MATSTPDTTVYIVLAIAGIVLSSVIIASLLLKNRIFIMIFSFYMIASFAYIFAIFVIKKKEAKLAPDIRYTVAEYMALFNMILSAFLFILIFFVPKGEKKEGLSLRLQ
jgi:hypothetical protein